MVLVGTWFGFDCSLVSAIVKVVLVLFKIFMAGVTVTTNDEWIDVGNTELTETEQ